MGSQHAPVSKDAPFSTVGFFDPGVGALVGAAAFLAGSSRISLFITVMIVEITGDPAMIFPVGVTTLVAVLVGNCFNDGLYTTQMTAYSIPFLPDRWPSEHIEQAIRVTDIISRQRRVVTVPLSGDRVEILAALEGNAHNGFPVVMEDGTMVGLAERRSLEDLLEGSGPSSHSFSDLMDETGTVDVGSVTDYHAVTVRRHIPVEIAYQLFQRMEMRHLVVVDDDHLPEAVLSRKNLLPWVVEKSLVDRHAPLQFTRPQSVTPGVHAHSSLSTPSSVEFERDVSSYR